MTAPIRRLDRRASLRVRAWRRLHAWTGHRVGAFRVDARPGRVVESYLCPRCLLFWVEEVDR